VRVAGGDARLVWVDGSFLAERGVGEWQELPLWIVDPAFRGLSEVDVSRALAAGLTFRPVEETVADTLAWARASQGAPPPRKSGVQLPPAGLTRDREAELLDEWRRAAA
jgi:2'-hydroxyisoflavone reductase